MSEIRKKQRLYFGAFILIFCLFCGFFAFLFSSPWTIDLKMSLLLVLLIVLLVIVLWFAPRLSYFTMQSAFSRLLRSAQPAVATRYDLSKSGWSVHLTQIGFQVATDSASFLLFHRVTPGPAGPSPRHAVLEIVIVIKDAALPYDHPAFARAINAVEDQDAAKKIRYGNHVILRIRSGETMTDALRREANQIVFDRQNGHGLAVINGHFDEKRQTLYFLHSKTYSPTACYGVACDLLLRLIS